MLFKLSLKNIRGSLRDYAIYFFTLIIGVSLFYVFNAIGSQAAMMKIEQSGSLGTLDTTLSVVSVFVASVLGLLIVYASRFLMKRRNREFALYIMMGMDKVKISRILVVETMMIGIISLSMGILLGIGLSQLMSALVANLFEADMSSYKFTVSVESIRKTIIYFSIMYLVVIIFNGVVVTRMKLINLIQSGKRSEKIKLKNPALCVMIFLIASAGLFYAYRQVGWNPKLDIDMLYRCFVIGAVATFLIFWSVSGMFLRVIMSRKKTYLKKLNAFTFRQISSSINTMVVSITIICLMLFITICALTSAFTLRNSLNANIKKYCAADFDMSIYYNQEDDNNPVDFNQIIEKTEKQVGHKISDGAKESVQFSTYADPDFLVGSNIANDDETITNSEFKEDIISVSDYNMLRKLMGKETVSIADDEYIVICDVEHMIKARNQVLKDSPKIKVFGHELKAKYNECQDGFIRIANTTSNSGIYVVADSVIDKKLNVSYHMVGNYQDKDKNNNNNPMYDRISDFYSKLRSNMSGKFPGFNAADLRFASDVRKDAVGIAAMITFIGLYIGVVFLVASGVMLALKELSQSVDSAARYDMLRKIGAEESDLSNSLLRQVGIFFMLPLVLAIFHSLFGMKFTIDRMANGGVEDIGFSIATTSIILLLIYGGYFLVTYYCSKGIIKGKR